MRPKVGIFWLIPIGEKQTLVCFTQDIEKASHTDMYYDSTFEHIKCWPKVLHKYPELKNSPYEKYPRGRITLVSSDHRQGGTFKLMADKKILAHEYYVQKLKELYNIGPLYELDILLDLHYRTK